MTSHMGEKGGQHTPGPSRAPFEVWFAGRFGYTPTFSDGGYLTNQAQVAWAAWQAAIADIAKATGEQA